MSCKDHIRLICKYNELSFYEKFYLKIHLFVCKNCARYKKHLEIINQKFSVLLQKITQTEEKDLQKINHKIEIIYKESGHES